MKLIRVCGGIYHSEPAGVTVFHRPWQNKDLPWVVCWTDIFSTRHEKWFSTLRECRDYLKEEQQ